MPNLRLEPAILEVGAGGAPQQHNTMVQKIQKVKAAVPLKPIHTQSASASAAAEENGRDLQARVNLRPVGGRHSETSAYGRLRGATTGVKGKGKRIQPVRHTARQCVLNLCSMANKVPATRHFVNDDNVSVMIITETRLPRVGYRDIRIPNSQQFSTFRRRGGRSRGGWLCLRTTQFPAMMSKAWWPTPGMS